MPKTLKVFLRKMIKFFKYKFRKFVIQRAVRNSDNIKIILGAAETFQRGWYSTNEQWLDIRKPSDWRIIFQNKKIISHAVAEHVFEHLSYSDCLIAMRLLSDHMTEKGRIRVAVPDGYNPNKEYLKHVGVDGIGADASDHKQLLTCDKLQEMLEQTGFEATLIEGYTKNGQLKTNQYKTSDGFIMRSRQNQAIKINAAGWEFEDAQTSLIMDGVLK